MRHVRRILIASATVSLFAVVLCLWSFKPDPELVNQLLKRAGQRQVAVLIDYDYPVFMRRLWVISNQDDLKLEGKRYRRGDVITTMHVAHALRSGIFKPTHFSNHPRSMLSSRGFMETYRSPHASPKHGYPALKVRGMDPSLNSLVMPRAIIFHKTRWPWSHGCFSTLPSDNLRLSKLIAGGVRILVHRTQPIDLETPLPFIRKRAYFDYSLPWLGTQQADSDQQP